MFRRTFHINPEAELPDLIQLEEKLHDVCHIGQRLLLRVIAGQISRSGVQYPGKFVDHGERYFNLSAFVFLDCAEGFAKCGCQLRLIHAFLFSGSPDSQSDLFRIMFHD